MSFIKTIAQLDRTDLPLAGGKGANLGALMRAGLPVPGGFVVTTDGYRAFVAANKLDGELRRVLESIRMDDPASLEGGSDQIRAAFAAGRMPEEIESAVRAAYAELRPQIIDDRPLSPVSVAVRSSATAEDLPDLSFAGQQDTYLNIIGDEALLDAMIRCWASLWTARAIGYRARNRIPQEDVALAVVVQQMVQSEASGVLFTANPLTGRRTETVIDATLGLGEALVSGQVEPDHYVVETSSGCILSKTLGAKALRIQGKGEGGTIAIERDESQRQALPDEQIVVLTQLGQRAAAHFGSPQDLEWAFAEGQIYVVQSRPITSLYPLPANVAAEPLEVLLSFGVWQGMLDPYTPLGQDMFSGLISGLARILGTELKPEEQRVMLVAGERIFVNLTGLLQTPTGREAVEGFLSSMDPVSSAILSKLLEELKLPVSEPVSLRNRLRLIRGLLPILYGVLFDLISPERGRARLDRKLDQELAYARSSLQAARTLSDLVETVASRPARLPAQLASYLFPGVISGQIPIQILIRLVADVPGGPDLALELTRGMPHNVTTEMDLALWRTAQSIRAEADTATYFNETDLPTLVSAYRKGRLPSSIQAAIAGFLSSYGMRGIGEVDLGRPRWNDDPTHIFQVLKNYLQIDPGNSPEASFLRGAEQAHLAEEQLIEKFRQSRGGRVKARLIRMMVLRLRELGGLRETPKFMIVRLFGHMRTALLDAGRKLVEQGVLSSAEDIFFLHLSELQALANGEVCDWQALIAGRRTVYQRELQRKHIPRILLSDGTAFYHAPASSAGEEENTLIGSPVSPGSAEGIVRVVLDPHGIHLAPGEILVCPATDPAWTPLFLTAGGLVMEVGGMMTHGSVVAREYGIPAVVGVQQATERLTTGQRVRVDGSSGKITLLPD